ncbi:hypothetical protein QQM35_05890 [Staphylococcus hsinchuensis]|uniref:Phage protein n=1 Tax=Staphylococcus hsinchuensis TaxID=3051183 RepID=A0ABZ3E9P2_9STAP
MITLQEIKQNLECSDVYAQKLIDDAQGDEKRLEDTYYRKLAERRIRSSIVEY